MFMLISVLAALMTPALAQATPPEAEEDSAVLSLEHAQGADSAAESTLTDAAAPAAEEAEEEAILLRAKRRVSPNWPMSASREGITRATCVVHIDVDARGKPSNAVASECGEVLYEAAINAAMKWRFHPLIVDGTPQESSTIVKFTFQRA